MTERTVAFKSLSFPAYRLLLVEDDRDDRDLIREHLAVMHDFDLTIDDAVTLHKAMTMVAQQR